MKKTLYLKFLAAYICFGVLSFIAVATFSSRLLQNHLIKAKTESMYKEANTVASGRLVQSYKNTSSTEGVYGVLNSLGAYQSVQIWLVDTEGRIILDTVKEYDPEMAVPIPGSVSYTHLTLPTKLEV